MDNSYCSSCKRTRVRRYFGKAVAVAANFAHPPAPPASGQRVDVWLLGASPSLHSTALVTALVTAFITGIHCDSTAFVTAPTVVPLRWSLPSRVVPLPLSLPSRVVPLPLSPPTRVVPLPSSPPFPAAPLPSGDLGDRLRAIGAAGDGGAAAGGGEADCAAAHAANMDCVRGPRGKYGL